MDGAWVTHAVPEVALYGDGTLIYRDDLEPSRFPAPPRLRMTRVPEWVIQRLLVIATDAGLADPTPFTWPKGVADGLVGHLAVEVGRHRVMHVIPWPELLGGDPYDLTEDEWRRRAAARTLADELVALAVDGTAWTPGAYDIFLFPDALGQRPSIWPSTVPFPPPVRGRLSAGEFGCVTIAAEDAESLLSADRDDDAGIVRVRPLLPHFTPCDPRSDWS